MKWKYSNFSDVVNDITGGNVKFQSSEYLSSGKYPIIDQGEKEIGGYTNEKNIVNRKKDVVVFGDHTKCLKFIDYDFCLGADGVKVLEPINELDTKFLYFYLSTITLPNVGYSRHFKFLKEIQIPLPPLPIQKRIAEILDAADALRRKDQELLRKYDELAQAIFIDMFGDPVKNEKGWEEKKLSDLFISGPRLGTITPVSVDGILPVVRVGELGNLNVAISQCKKVKLNDVEKKKYLLQINDILLARAIGSLDHLGKASLIQESNEEIVFDSHVMRLQFDQKKINSFFFYTWLQSKGGREIFLQNAGKTAVQFNINGNQISQIRINLPEISLQERFTEIVLFVQNQRMKVVIQKKNSDILFDSLLQQAFKGELVK